MIKTASKCKRYVKRKETNLPHYFSGPVRRSLWQAAQSKTELEQAYNYLSST